MTNFRKRKVLFNRKKGKLDAEFHPSVYVELGGRNMTERSYLVWKIEWKIERKRRIRCRISYYRYHYGYK